MAIVSDKKKVHKVDEYLGKELIAASEGVPATRIDSSHFKRAIAEGVIALVEA